MFLVPVILGGAPEFVQVRQQDVTGLEIEAEAAEGLQQGRLGFQCTCAAQPDVCKEHIHRPKGG